MSKLIECIPNFSEGRRPEVIDEIVAAITSVEGAYALAQEMDPDHNRAVVTFASDPDVVVEAAFRGISKAAELIDMQTHTGEHPRMGATDVCPLVPLDGVTTEDAVTLANQLGARVGKELQIPVYMYEDAAKIAARKNLAKARRGQYEGIRDEIETVAARKPDYGPAKMNLKAGATAIGARFPLVAYNVYLGTNDITIAQKIADAVRHLRGGLRFVKALGFEIKERNQVQVSMNLVNYTKSPVFRVFEMIKSEAERYGVAVTSSEIVGLVPQAALMDVSDFYLRLENFTPDQVLENKLKQVVSGGAGGVSSDFYADVASSSPAPGGGSVSASAGALAAALAGMVCRLTVKKKKFADVRDELLEVSARADALRKELTELIVEDEKAFDAVMAAFALPKSSDEQIAERQSAIAESSRNATLVPMKVVESSLESLRLAKIVAEKGNPNSITDAGVAGLLALAGIEGAGYNARINLKDIDDAPFCQGINDRLAKMMPEAEKLGAEIRELVEKALV
jgi:glutamate formiminotransferase / formiminotetrahydrofolate cyclodeaminase